MLDFHGLFASYVALFPGGVDMEIESLRLDLHLKRKQKKPHGSTNVFIGEERKKKKKKNPGKKVFEEGKKKKKKPDARPGFATQRPGSRRDRSLCRRPGSGAAWVLS